MRRKASREELLVLMRRRDRWYVEHALLKAIKRAPWFKARVEELIADAENRLLEVGPDFQPEPHQDARENHTAEPGVYRHEMRRLERPKRRQGKLRPVLRIATSTPDQQGLAMIHYDDVVLN